MMHIHIPDRNVIVHSFGRMITQFCINGQGNPTVEWLQKEITSLTSVSFNSQTVLAYNDRVLTQDQYLSDCGYKFNGDMIVHVVHLHQ